MSEQYKYVKKCSASLVIKEMQIIMTNIVAHQSDIFFPLGLVLKVAAYVRK